MSLTGYLVNALFTDIGVYMPTKKVVRKQTRPVYVNKTRSVKYNKNYKFTSDDDSKKAKQDYLDNFKTLLDDARKETKRTWDRASKEEKEEMILEFLLISGKTQDRNKYFSEGKPDYESFVDDVFNISKGTDYAVVDIDNKSKKAKSVRGWFLRHKDLDEDDKRILNRHTDYYSYLAASQKEKVKKEIKKLRQKIQRDSLQLTPSILEEIKKSVKTGSPDDKVKKILEDPEIFRKHLATKVAIKGSGINANRAREMWEAIYGYESDLPKNYFEEVAKSPPDYLTREAFDEPKAKIVAAAVGYDSEAGKKSPATKALMGFINKDDELSGVPVEQAIKGLDGKTITWSEIVAYNNGKVPSIGPIKKKFNALGLSIEGIPEGKTGKAKKKKRFGSLHKSSGYVSSGSYGGSSYSSGGSKVSPKSWFSRNVYATDRTGNVKGKKQRGRISQAFKKAKDKTVGAIHPKPKDRVRDFDKKYGDYLDKDILEEDKMIMGKTKGVSGWVKRRLAERQASRLVTDPAYREKKIAERELDKGIRVARILKAQREAQAQQRAATSPFYGAFYSFSKYSKWIALTALIIAILFIPMGMFYVLGWALAVAVIALFQFIIWVFMEIWFLLAQAVVAIVGLIGQVFIMVINWVGRAISGVLNQPYTPFEHQLVQNMLMFERDPATGNWVVFTYTDLSGLTEAEIAEGAGRRELLTWGALNLTPPAFLNLELYKPTEFDTNPIIGHIIPPLRNFFSWMYTPIANRYTNWITNLPAEEWYWVGIIIGVPAILIIIGIILIWRYAKRKYQMV